MLKNRRICHLKFCLNNNFVTGNFQENKCKDLKPSLLGDFLRSVRNYKPNLLQVPPSNFFLNELFKRKRPSLDIQNVSECSCHCRTGQLAEEWWRLRVKWCSCENWNLLLLTMVEEVLKKEARLFMASRDYPWTLSMPS